MTPEPRPTSRVLVVDRRDRLLLFDGVVPDRERTRLWCPPGGGLRADETFEEAAVRELREETGIADVALGPCVWRREHACEWRDKWYLVQERYFLVRVGAAEVRPTALEPDEAGFLLGHRWWSAAEIAASRETFVPRRLADLLPPLLRGDIPPEPVAVGI
jgi:ADP-ribose pyrophosphatase YjhB (NUDIX family)